MLLWFLLNGLFFFVSVLQNVELLLKVYKTGTHILYERNFFFSFAGLMEGVDIKT